jgi:hypothetical protein
MAFITSMICICLLALPIKAVEIRSVVARDAVRIHLPRATGDATIPGRVSRRARDNDASLCGYYDGSRILLDPGLTFDTNIYMPPRRLKVMRSRANMLIFSTRHKDIPRLLPRRKSFIVSIFYGLQRPLGHQDRRCNQILVRDYVHI